MSYPAELPKYDIVPAIEHHLGFPLPSRTSHCLSAGLFRAPWNPHHGAEISNACFVPVHDCAAQCHSRDDAPAVRLRTIQTILRAIDALGKDSLIAEKVKHHNPSFGYNTVPAYIEEDSVQALEEIISEEFGVGHDPVQYWKEQDDGMHVLAAAIYEQYKRVLKAETKHYSQWFSGAVADGTLRGEISTENR